MAESICWDGKAATLERIREVMPDCLGVLVSECLYVKTLRKISARKSLPDETVVPLGWYVTRKSDGVATIRPPKLARA